MFLEDPQRAERNHKHADIGGNVVGRVPPRGGISGLRTNSPPDGVIGPTANRTACGGRPNGPQRTQRIQNGVRQRETPPL